MALFAAHTKLTVMDIFGPMTRHAVVAQRRGILAFGCLLLVTALASHFTVRPVKFVFTAFVVIEVPQLPGTGVVAALATHTKFELVLVFLLVTGETVTRSVFESRCQVATLAGCRNMPSGKREPR